jgi:tetratricopeptide (TPR) repeat protein/glutathione synthase/RimK-type ligase-like ATP-grasp enzyme
MTISQVDQMIAKAFAHHQAGDMANAEMLYRSALIVDPGNVNALQLLGLLNNTTGNHSEAVSLLTRAVALLEKKGTREPQHAALYNNFGNALRAVARGSDAVVQYRVGIALDPGLPDLHANLADELCAQGKFDDAITSYETAQKLAPLNSARLCLFGSAYAFIKKFREAEITYRLAVAPLIKETMLRKVQLEENADAGTRAAHGGAALEPAEPLPALENIGSQIGQIKLPIAVEPYRQLIRSIPTNPDLYYLFATALREEGDRVAALEMFKLGVEIDPNHVACLYDLGVSLGTTGLAHLAVPILERAIKLKPDFADFHLQLGNTLHHIGETERAFECYHQANRLQPVRTWHAITASLGFSVLAIEAPGVANTPSHFLLKNSSFDCHFFALLAETKPNVEMLRQTGNVVINLISDVDTGRHILPMAANLVSQLGKPVINHPLKIVETDRQTVAQRLGNIQFCRVPNTIRCRPDELAIPGAIKVVAQNGLGFPILLRVVGTHGGDALEKLNDTDEVEKFLKQHQSKEYYVTEFVDYRSNDGFYRKYRFIFVDGEIFPYHLAIHDTWKVHHFRTDMENHLWMQEEEAAFLADPWRTFSSGHQVALREIHKVIDLEFFGLDCSLDSQGNILVFEVNASMLVHDDNMALPYKTFYCARIKGAFHDMLLRATGVNTTKAVA